MSLSRTSECSLPPDCLSSASQASQAQDCGSPLRHRGPLMPRQSPPSSVVPPINTDRALLWVRPRTHGVSVVEEGQTAHFSLGPCTAPTFLQGSLRLCQTTFSCSEPQLSPPPHHTHNCAHLSSDHSACDRKGLRAGALALNSFDCNKFEIARQRHCSEGFILVFVPSPPPVFRCRRPFVRRQASPAAGVALPS